MSEILESLQRLKAQAETRLAGQMKMLNDSEATFQYASRNGLKSLVKQAQNRLTRQRMAVALTEAEIRELESSIVKETSQVDAFPAEVPPVVPEVVPPVETAPPARNRR